MINTLSKTLFLLLLAWICCCQVNAQERVLTIEDAYKLARQNYPLIRQRELIARTRDFSVENAWRGFLPQVAVQGQATYQSAVTALRLPAAIPGFEFPVVSKDQYKVYGEVTQAIYDGGATRTQAKLHEANALAEEQKLEVELYKLNERVNQLYFGVLVAEEQLKQNAIFEKDIQLGIRKVEALVANGTALESNANTLKAELMKAHQRSIELNAGRNAYLAMLGALLNQELDGVVKLVKPQPPTLPAEVQRPELKLFDIQSENLSLQDRLLDVRNRPKLSLFFQGGFGRPALNILNNDFDAYYLGGARLSWPLSGLYTLKNDRRLIANNRQSIQLQRETFLFNTSLTSKQQYAELAKFGELLATDDALISLRENIKSAAAAQLENGISNSSDYLREVNAEDQSRQNKILHEIQLLMAAYNLQNTLGKPLDD